jgi:hypothetical protein
MDKVSILLGNGAKRNEPKDTADSPMPNGEAARNQRAGAKIRTQILGKQNGNKTYSCKTQVSIPFDKS